MPRVAKLRGGDCKESSILLSKSQKSLPLSISKNPLEDYYICFESVQDFTISMYII